MLSSAPVTATMPMTDIDRAKVFYMQKLELELIRETRWSLEFRAGNGTSLFLYERAPTRADHTAANFAVGDIEMEIDALVQKGVVFLAYDLPGMGIKTDERGIATMGDIKSAWFNDSEGNILGLTQGM